MIFFITCALLFPFHEVGVEWTLPWLPRSLLPTGHGIPEYGTDLCGCVFGTAKIRREHYTSAPYVGGVVCTPPHPHVEKQRRDPFRQKPFCPHSGFPKRTRRLRRPHAVTHAWSLWVTTAHLRPRLHQIFSNIIHPVRLLLSARLISRGTVFFSHNKIATAAAETACRTG
jgi:hypothetical protein